VNAVVRTQGDRCRRCYSCVRRCPARAIRVRDGQAEVLVERCVACGRCLKVCPADAKKLADGLPVARELLSTGRAVAMLAPSFPAAFPDVAPGQVVSALREAGFAAVHEVAFGADLVSAVHHRLFEQDPEQLTLTTACPAVVGYVEKYAPELVPNLAPVLSPMAALGKALKSRISPGCHTVFLGPCTAKIREAADPQVSPWVDAVLTFTGLHRLFEARGVDPGTLPAGEFDPPRSLRGGAYPIPGGLSWAAGLPSGLLDSHVHATIGIDDFVDSLERLRARVKRQALGEMDARFFDVLFCKGCVQGPAMNGGESPLRRRERVVRYLRSRQAPSESEWQAEMDALADLDLGRGFAADDQTPVAPSEEAIRQILADTGKRRPEDELNCRACGYRSCREKAVAVYQGLAEVEMCLPFLISRLEATVEKLNRSHEQLSDAQTQLLRTERLASMGQLAAGIAHEVNNPLGSILIYANLLSEDLASDPERRADAELILREAARCRTIVGGLLDFARQSKLRRSTTDLRALAEEAVANVAAQAANDRLAYRVECPPDLPGASVDRDQLLQVLLNLVRNAADVMGEGGMVRVDLAYSAEAEEHVVSVSDSGPGIAPEHMAKLFSPFFTTKPVGRGTGLGLPICYGIVKMHRGSITARNNTPGPGATFEVRLPAQGGEECDA
jgi:two-component system, NtrC family, sensor kinase